MAWAPLQIGETLRIAGFFGKALFLRSQPSHEIERRLGYRAGRLQKGWYLLFLTQMPKPTDFEVAGYSHFSGGVPQGHLGKPPDPRTSEQRLSAEGYDLHKIKQGLIRQTFHLVGSDRLAKVIPVADEHRERGIPDYPPGSGVPQWKLVSPLNWRVAAAIGPGETYTGNYL